MTSIYKRKGRKGVTLEYQDLSGKLRQKHFKTRRAAEDRALVLRDTPDPGRAITLKEHALRWIERRRSTVRASTLAVYDQQLQNHILPALGHYRLEQITRGAVKDFLAGKLNAGMARSSVANIRAALHGCLEDAVEEDILRVNPAKLRLRAGPQKEEEVRALTLDQLRAFLAAAREHSPGYYPFFHLLAMTGLRIGEGLALQWDHIDWKQRHVLVHQTWSQSKLGATKTGRDRTVDLAAPVVEELRALEVAAKAQALKDGKQRSPWVFSTSYELPWLQRPVYDDFKRLTKKAALPGYFSPHSLRHTYASIMLARGEKITYVQQQLGHRSISMTVDLYGRWLPQADPQAADRFAALVSDLSVTAREQEGTREQAQT